MHARPYPRLRKLRLLYYPYSAHGRKVLPYILPLMPRLEELHIQGQFLPDLEEEISSSYDTPFAFPPLRKLALHEIFFEEKELASFIDRLRECHPRWEDFQVISIHQHAGFLPSSVSVREIRKMLHPAKLVMSGWLERLVPDEFDRFF